MNRPLFFFRHWRHTLCALSLGLSGLAWADTAPAEVQQLLQRGQPAQALQRIDQALASTPDRPDLTFYRGVALTELNRDEEALAVFRALNRTYPESPEPLNNLGVLLARQGQWPAAVDALQAALKLDPQYHAAHENLGDVYTRMAAQAYQSALQSPTGKSSGHAEAKWRLVSQIAPLQPAQATAAPKATGKVGPSPATPATPRGTATVEAEAGKPTANTPAPAELSPAVQRLHAALQRWADAWSRRDVEAYTASYTPGYAPAGMTREQWLTQRRTRIAGKTSISVALNDIETQINGDKATVRLVQRYSANDHRSVDRKTLVLRRDGDTWRIEQERNH